MCRNVSPPGGLNPDLNLFHRGRMESALRPMSHFPLSRPSAYHRARSVKDAARRLRRWPAAIPDSRCARWCAVAIGTKGVRFRAARGVRFSPSARIEQRAWEGRKRRKRRAYYDKRAANPVASPAKPQALSPGMLAPPVEAVSRRLEVATKVRRLVLGHRVICRGGRTNPEQA